eukprot:3765384-Rhodomonas_salina.1
MHNADGAGDFEGEEPEDDYGVMHLQQLPVPLASVSAPPETSTENTMLCLTHAERITGSAEPEPVTMLLRSVRVLELLMKQAQPVVTVTVLQQWQDGAAMPVLRTQQVQSPLAYRQWTAGAQIQSSAALTQQLLLTDLQLAKALVHHEYVLTLPEDWWKHPATQQPTACTV